MARPRQGILGLILALALAIVLVAAQGKPESAVSSFKNLPARLFFFDDTDTAIYHDSMEGNLYVSTNEGKTWKLAPGIPEGKVMMVFEHPTDNRYAFALTDGKTHYRTEDRGHTWRSFDVPLPPAMTARPLSFHSDPKKYDYILYQGTSCSRRGMSASCHDETYYTTKAFGDDVKLLLKDVERCQFAHSSKEFKHEAHEDLIYCVGFDTSSSSGSHSLAASKLFSSTDFFQKDNKIEDLGIGKNARGVIAFAIVSKFAVVALKDMTKSTGDMLLYVTVDTKTWAQAHFPHASSAQLRENAYTMLESTTHSLAVDVVLQDKSPIGTLFISNGNGTYFVESLKDTNRNELGYVDFERIYGVEGIGLANVVANAAAVEGRGAAKSIRTVATFDDGSSWVPLRPPIEDVEGKTIHCDPKDSEECALHLHSVTSPHNFGRIFSSPAPGFVMGVGSIGKRLLPYTECDTFLSTDAGVTWRMVARGAHKYEFGDLGSILIAVDDEDTTSEIKYSLDLGKTWKTYDFGVRLRARGLITLPDSTSQKFLLLGQVARPDQTKEVGRVVIVALDFLKTRGKKCRDDDFEKWFARPHDSECLLGHKQWYKRRKPDADCYVGDKYNDPVVHDEPCKCTDADYECDYNFVREGDKCVLQGHEKIPPNVCPPGKPDQEYEGSSGFRKIAGDTCEGGIKKDEPVKRKCSQAAPPEGDIASHVHPFDSPIVQHAFFKDSKTILVRLKDNSVWQSSNEGQTWNEPVPKGEFWGFYHHRFSSDRAYLITASNVFWYTTDTGRSWNEARAPTPPNSFGAQVLRFHPTSDNLIWVGNKDCEHVQSDCHAEAHYTRDNGREWTPIETYVRNCAFARDTLLDADPTEIMCESYKTKKGQQRILAQASQPELVVGANYYDSRRQKKLFGGVIGFAKFSEFLVVAETHPEKRGLNLQVSLDGEHFAPGQFPPMMHPDTHEYTVLESNTKALFMFMTISERPMPFWGTILKSNSNGTYFGISLDLVNRDGRGYVDFEKLIGLDGIALVNVVSNPDEAMHSGKKELQSRITHNDGSTWTTLPAPLKDSLGKEYSCKQAKCSLHIHGYTERPDPRATYSTPSVPGLLMAVGNVGESLAPYIDSDTFLSRDAGFTWEEVHKDAHLWEFGDSGSIIVMANDEEPVDYVLYSTDEGLSWKEYTFSPKGDKIRIRSIVTVPSDTSRKFILLGEYPKTRGSVAVQIDFTSLTFRQCKVSVEDPGHDDFELWSPSEVRAETCLFGRQTKYHRRMRTADCVVGEQTKPEDIIVNNCACTKADFECEFNYMKDHDDNCILVPGTTPLPDDDSCSNGEEYWYERTAYRRVSYSTCEDGYRPDRGTQHVCPGFRSKGSWFWFWMLLLPFAFTAVVAYYYWKRSGLARGTIRLPGDTRRSPFASQDSGMMATLASVPWFIIGVGGIAYEWVASRLQGFGAQRGYRHVPIDEDAQILRFEDEE